jgi:hypothetical protein
MNSLGKKRKGTEKFSLRRRVPFRARVSRLLSAIVNILLQRILTFTTAEFIQHEAAQTHRQRMKRYGVTEHNTDSVIV